MPYKGLKDADSILTNDLVPLIRHVRKHHFLTFQIPFADIDIYKSSFFPQLLEIGIHLQIRSFLQLKVQKTLLLSSLLL